MTTTPEPPRFQRVIHGIEKDGNDDYQFTEPYLPPMTTTRDGRIGIMRKRFVGTGNLAQFYVIRPEALSADENDPGEPFLESAPGPTLLSTVVEVPVGPFDNNPTANTTGDPPSTNVDRATHFAICEGNAENPTTSVDDDLYQFKVISAVRIRDQGKIQLWSSDVEVRVSDPKTKDAAIVGPVTVTTASSTGHIAIEAKNVPVVVPEFHTPMIVGDDRLIVVRIGAGTEIEWTSHIGTHTGSYDTVYAYYPDGDPCDITKWTNFKPLAYAPHDPDLEGSGGEKLFGFADYEFRTPEGDFLPSNPDDIYDIGGRYIWMDFEAKNIFFATMGRKLIDQSLLCTLGANCSHVYDLGCLDSLSGCVADDPDIETAIAFFPKNTSESIDFPERIQNPPHLGWTVAGRWTHGKMVMLDANFNNIDFGVKGNEEHNRKIINLYDGLDYRIGNGRTDRPIDSDWYSLDGWPGTGVQFGSPEHLFNFEPNLRPRTPRDVVWLASAGSFTDEIAFDDYLDRGMLIFSPMNSYSDPSVDMNSTGSTLPIAIHPYYDGLEPNTNYAEMRLQNAATTEKWDIPRFASVNAAAGEGRVESVALGGIHGKGFFLFPDSNIEYEIPQQDPSPDPDVHDWTISLFIDPYFEPSSGPIRRLITLAKGHVDLSSLQYLQVCSENSASCSSLLLPKPLTQGWTHLAIQIDNQDPGTSEPEKVRFSQDGFLFAEIDLPADFGLFESSGTSLLEIGSSSAGAGGFRGWIDELRVFEGPLNYELMCNHAHGTMLAVPPSYTCAFGTDCVPGSVLDELLSPFHHYETLGNAAALAHGVDGRGRVHDALHGTAPQALSDHYLCHVDYSQALGISVHDPGDPAARSIRQALQFPEGPVAAGALRPDSSMNGFCLSCHDVQEKGGLTVQALTVVSECGDPLGDCVMEVDPRRQPLQGPPLMLGHVPAGLFAHAVGTEDGKPSMGLQGTAQDPISIDSWIHDGPLYLWSFDEGSGMEVANRAVGDPEVGSTGGSVVGAEFMTESAHRTPFLEFDGTDHVLVDDAIGIEGKEISLTAWFRMDADAATNCTNPGLPGGSPCTLIAKAGDDQDWVIRLFKQWNQWYLFFLLEFGDGLGDDLEMLSIILDGSFVPTEWHHVAATFDGGELELFLDGVRMDGESVSMNASSQLDAGAQPVVIGAKKAPGGVGTGMTHFFRGAIDDVRIYRRALLEWEIAELESSTP